MSYTTIKAIWPGEKCEDLKELRNSHGSAPIVWGVMCKKYISGEFFSWYRDSEKLFELHKRFDIPIYQRAVLMITYDRAYVLRKDYAQAAADIREFLKTADIPSNYVNHWPRIADLFDSNPDIPAIGFHMTSVSDDPFLGKWNEETEECNPLDWSECWSVYDVLWRIHRGILRRIHGRGGIQEG